MTFRRVLASLLPVLFLNSLLASASTAAIVMTVTPSSAPNFFGSPSWAGYESNGMTSIEFDLGDIGDRELDPAAYQAFELGELISVDQLIVSNFHSWLGEAAPAPPFDQEYGNRLHFGLHIVGDGLTRFRLEDLSFEMTSSDDGNVLGFVTDFSASDYSTFRLGIDYGADRMKGGGDDVIITSGTGDQLIDELVYIGSGNAFDASFADGVTDQDKLNSIRDSIGGFVVTGSYTLEDSNGGMLATGSSFVVVVPEPGTLGLIAVLGAAGMLRRRR